ncbi:MAG: RNA polymerase sigma-70 factor [Cyclobacteriaceae bacterium]
MSDFTKEKEFSGLFEKYYQRLYNYAYKSIRNKELCEGLIQETFLRLWENMDALKREGKPVEGFLVVTLRNKMIDSIRRKKVREKHEGIVKMDFDMLTEDSEVWDLISRIDTVFSNLPNKTVEVFQLSRKEGLTYSEIAERMAISVKTVEMHMSKALAAFRKGLKDFL